MANLPKSGVIRDVKNEKPVVSISETPGSESAEPTIDKGQAIRPEKERPKTKMGGDRFGHGNRLGNDGGVGGGGDPFGHGGKLSRK